MRTRSLARIGRLATLPETRGLIVAAAQSETIREMARQAVHDRAGLVRAQHAVGPSGWSPTPRGPTPDLAGGP